MEQLEDPHRLKQHRFINLFDLFWVEWRQHPDALGADEQRKGFDQRRRVARNPARGVREEKMKIKT